VCISNRHDLFQALDSRVRSRIGPALIEFSAYSNDQIRDIIRHYLNGEPSEPAKRFIRATTAAAKGDARLALQLMRHCAGKLDGSDAEQFVSKAEAYEAKRMQHLLSRLGSHYEIIYRLIVGNGEMRSGDLARAYRNYCA